MNTKQKVLSLAKIYNLIHSKKIKIDIDYEDFINLLNLCVGFYKPIHDFSNLLDVHSIIKNNRTYNNKNWTIPILLRCKSKKKFKKNQYYLLRFKNKTVGCLKFKDLFEVNKKEFTKKVFGTLSKDHPGAKRFLKSGNIFFDCECYIARELIPKNKYFKKALLISTNKKRPELKNSIAFSTRNICHKGHEFILNYLKSKYKNLFIVLIKTPENKYDPNFLIKSYEHLKKIKKIPFKIVNIYLPLFLAGPREAFIQSKVISNIGIKTFLIGRDHAGVKKFYNKYDSQKIFLKVKAKKPIIEKIKEPLLCLNCNKIKFSDGEQKCFSCYNKKNLVGINGVNVKKLLLKKSNKVRKFLDDQMLSFIKKNRRLI